MMAITEFQKIGVGLMGFGLFFLLFGVLLYFDSVLLAFGNSRSYPRNRPLPASPSSSDLQSRPSASPSSSVLQSRPSASPSSSVFQSTLFPS